MPQKEMGFGLLGAGLIAPFHASSLKDSEKARLVAVADMDQARAQAIAKEFGCKCCTTLDELLADDEIEVINVLTPNHVHHDPVLKIAAAGKHALVEKPPSMSLRETDSMVEACANAGVKLGIVLQCRIRQTLQAMKLALGAGRFGKVLQADAYMKWWREPSYYHRDAWRSSRRSGAGVTIQHAFHYIDLLQYLMGPAKRVWARMTNLAHPDVELEDTLMAIIEYENGAQGLVEASTAFWPGQDLRIEVCGSNGAATMVGERTQLWQFRDDRPEDEEIRQYGSAAVQTGASSPTALSHKDHQVVIEDMVDAIREGREPVISCRSVRPALEMALGMYLSAKRGEAVELPIRNENEIWA